MDGMSRKIDRPIIFLGNARSGTTIIFEAFSVHQDLGWLSNYSQTFPRFPVLNLMVRIFDNRLVYLRGEKKQHQRIYPLNRFLPRPTEAYPFWERYAGPKFNWEYLLNTDATLEEKRSLRETIAKILAYQGKPRFAVKITGPSRIRFLKTIFPDAYFIHIIRDGRAVVNSLLHAEFWREKGGFERPFWGKGFKREYEEIWVASGRDPAVLAALQWRNIIEVAREESQGLNRHRYCELRYEDFMEDPHKHLSRLYEFVGLNDSERAHTFVDTRTRPKDMNYKFRENFDSETLEKINRIMGELLDPAAKTVP